MPTTLHLADLWSGKNPTLPGRSHHGIDSTTCFYFRNDLKIGPEQSSLADTLTLSRAATGAVLAGLVASGIRDRKGIAGWIGWLMPLFGVTDWLDGPLARRAGPTCLGGVLDIEADSWLTLWSAAGAVAWGNIPALVSTPSNHTLFGTHASFDARQTSSRWRSMVVSLSWREPDGTSHRCPRTFRLAKAQAVSNAVIIAR